MKNISVSKILFKALIPCILLFCCISHLTAKSSLYIKTNTPKAFVFLDEQPAGSTNSSGEFYLADLDAGSYTLKISKDSYNPFILKIILADGLTKTVSAKLNKKRPVSKPSSIPGKKGSLFLNINISGAKISLDNNYLGDTGPDGNFYLETTFGHHTLEIKKEGFESYKETFHIKSELTESLQVSLVPKKEPESFQNILIVSLFILLVILVVLVIYMVIRLSGIGFHGRGKFDRYKILKIIGRGGMATIYKAKDSSSGQIVALKIMDVSFLKDMDLVNKFLKEGKAIYEINQAFPAVPVVKALRYGRENNRTHGRPFIAMELLRGQNLLELIREKKNFSMEFVLNVIEQVAEALKAAHAKGIYHRDITPDNVIVTRYDSYNPVIRLIDFGIARHEYTATGTLDGSISGKPPYMSPEQCRGEKVDRRSDIYSLGIIFYTLLIGNPPFLSNNPLEVMKDHEKTPVPPLNPKIPDKVKKVILKMLEKDSSGRHQHIDELLADIRDVII
jgi:predicted Ser/Thr protein kinase